MTREEVQKAIDAFNELGRADMTEFLSERGKAITATYNEAKKWQYHYGIEDARKVWKDITKEMPTNQYHGYILIHISYYKNDYDNTRERWKRGGGYVVVRPELIRKVKETFAITEDDNRCGYKFKYWQEITDICPLLNLDDGHKDEIEEL